MATTPATLTVNLLASKGSVRLLKAAARAGRVATLRELAADLNARADVLEAAGQVETCYCADNGRLCGVCSGG
jgi:hypothetical protein